MSSFEHKIVYVSVSQIVIENDPENRIAEADFYAGLDFSGNMVTGEWTLLDGTRLWMSEANTEQAVFMFKARLANKGICVGEQNPYVLQAEKIH